MPGQRAEARKEGKAVTPSQRQRYKAQIEHQDNQYKETEESLEP